MFSWRRVDDTIGDVELGCPNKSSSGERETCVGGLVLCGGLSRRMGRDKATLAFGGGTMLEHVIGSIADVVSPIVVACRSGQTIRIRAADVIRVDDSTAERGPLEGLACGLAALAGRRHAAFVTGCDYPNLTADFVRLLIDGLAGAEICAVRDEKRLHPIPAVYSVSLAERARSLLTNGQSSLLSLLDQSQIRTLDIKELTAAGCNPDVLTNLNVPTDLSATSHNSRSRN